VTDALGLTLAEDVVADRGYPPFPRAMMDGYAVRLADAGSTVPVVGEVAAGQSRDEPLRDGTAVSIMTGAPCPPGTEAVVPHEETTIGDEDVALPADLTPGRHIAPTGCECAAGVVVAVQGEEVTPLVIANLATFGYTEVSVVPPPRCAVVTTGSELVAPASEPGIAQIRDSNGPMMAAMTRLIGVSDVRQLHAGDTEQALDSKLADTEESDVVILTGGVSAGKYDLVPGTLEAHGVEIVFHKVMQKPGKPLLFGHIGSRLFFGLPGNPLACHMGFNRYIAPAIRKMMGKDPSPRVGEGRLATSVEPRGSRTRFMPCRTVPVDDGWKINVLNGKGSADIFASCPANSYIRVEPGTETLQEGTLVPFEWNWNSP
jgi:molybdopterin molybdotransferase